MRRSIRAGLLAGALLALPAVATAASPPPQTTFDGEIQASKTAMMGEPKAAFSHAEAAAKAAAAMPQGAGRDLAVATAQWLEGESSIRMRKLAEGEGYLRNAAETAARLDPDSKLQADILRSQGRGSAALGRVQPALADYQEAFRIYQRVNEPRKEAMVLQDIGSVYADARDYAHVLQYYRQSSEVFASDPALTLTAHNNRATALKALGRLPEAVTEFRAALAAATELKSDYLQANILTDLASAEADLNQLDQARIDASRGLSLATRDVDAKTERPMLLSVLAKIDARSGAVAHATRLLDQAFAGVDLSKTPMEYRDFHEIASRIYARAGQDGLALKHLNAFKRLDDQGRELAVSTNAALMAAQFDFANQNLKIAQLKSAQLEADARQRSLILTGLLLAGGSILGATLFGLLSMRRSRNKIRAANAQLGVANTALERALKAKTEFLATTSHEIRTPLNGILGMTQVILADRSLSEPVRERLALVKSSGETMKSLVDDLLDVAKVETGAISIVPEPFDLHRTLKEIEVFWSAQAQAKGLKLSVEAGETPRRIVADETRLRQVLFNLMSNALKFTETGEVTVKAAVEADAVMFRVHDTGIGIPLHEQERIFEAFTQVDTSTSRKYGGTGLGLSICRSVAIAMGGGIHVDSAGTLGSTFVLRLPLQIDETAQATEGLAATLEDAAVLIVDANLLAQSMMKAVVAPASRAVACANSIDAAAERLADEPSDMIIADANILGDDPGQALSLLRGAFGGPIVVTWPAATAPSAPVVSAEGADAVILKPSTPADILSALRGLLARTPAFADAALGCRNGNESILRLPGKVQPCVSSLSKTIR